MTDALATHILKLVVFILPIYIANTTPVLAAKFRVLEFLNKPVDFNIKFFGKPLFGANKTIRGYVVGVTLGTLFAVLLHFVFQFWTFNQALLYGFLVSLGSLIGDTVKSFFKRRINVKPGEDWVPFDQLDYSVGALLISAVAIRWTWKDYVFLISLSLVLHFIANILKKFIWKK